MAGNPGPRRYSVVITPRAERDLRKIKDRAVRARIVAAIDALELDPRPPGVKVLRDDDLTVHRIRVGDYRVLYTIEDKKLVVTVVTAGHRREVYR